MQVSKLAEIISASIKIEESFVAIFDNKTNLPPLDACVALNQTLAASELFAVPLEDGSGLLIIHEPSFIENPDVAEVLKSITVKNGFSDVKKEHLL